MTKLSQVSTPDFEAGLKERRLVLDVVGLGLLFGSGLPLILIGAAYGQGLGADQTPGPGLEPWFASIVLWCLAWLLLALSRLVPGLWCNEARLQRYERDGVPYGENEARETDPAKACGVLCTRILVAQAGMIEAAALMSGLAAYLVMQNGAFYTTPLAWLGLAPAMAALALLGATRPSAASARVIFLKHIRKDSL